MTANWAVSARLGTPVQVMPATRVADATPVLSTDFDVRTLPHGARPVLLLSAFETNVANTGGTWTVTESATDGGSYTACTISTALVATPATAGNQLQITTVYPNPAKPFVLVTYTGADANTEVDIAAVMIPVPPVV